MYTDFHAHILPGMDHGSTSTETTRNQLSAAKELGISTIVATSHFYPDIHRVGSYLRRGIISEKTTGFCRGPTSYYPWCRGYSNI